MKFWGILGILGNFGNSGYFMQFWAFGAMWGILDIFDILGNKGKFLAFWAILGNLTDMNDKLSTNCYQIRPTGSRLNDDSVTDIVIVSRVLNETKCWKA